MSDFLKEKCGDQYSRLESLANPALMEFVEKYAKHCGPDSIFVVTDSEEDAAHVRKMALEKGEEKSLKNEGHTIHFDGPKDQGRDPKNTKFLFGEGENPGNLNGIDRVEGEKDVLSKLKDIMKGRTMLVTFFALGPVDSPFYIPAVQLTDSYYVAHSEAILYRAGYEGFKKNKPASFFKVVHGTGEVDDRMCSKNVEDRRIYMDLKNDLVYSCNTQYAGNTVGFKKLALRLAIQKAGNEGWLAEHMFVMGVKGPNGRKSYFSGAFPSMCGKTSTAMVEGESIIGDDIAYLRNIDGICKAVNVEQGIFGIIQDINHEGDPLIWELLNSPGNVIVSNILNVDGAAHWLGDKRNVPDAGENFAGMWKKGDVDENGKEIAHAHKNARYTIGLDKLANVDENLHASEGVELKGIVYGGRDSDTSVPVRESFGWDHGVITMGASIESETTAATLGSEGERKFNIMANQEFVSIPLAKYLVDYLGFGQNLKTKPSIFATNYFLRGEDGKWLNGIKDKRVWLKWMELRANGDVEAITTPVGNIPLYEDLKKLFKDVMSIDFTPKMYDQQFTLRIPENLSKIDRITDIYKNKVADTPEKVFTFLNEQKERLLKLQGEKGDYVKPAEMA